jgi:hypothetical protein
MVAISPQRAVRITDHRKLSGIDADRPELSSLIDPKHRFPRLSRL